MATAPLSAAVSQLRKALAAQNGRDLTDGQLLSAFLAGNDQAAFAVLVQRHGPLVMRVCRHLLPAREDAEDAFQATFLVLARKARSIRKKASLSGWLHGVARRIALTARRAAGRRRAHEGKIQPDARPHDSSWEPAWREVQAILDEEVERLADKYRLPFVLCCLEGRSRAEAARHLGWKDGTLSSRLDRARKLLQERLAKRGVTLSAVLAAAALAPDIVTAAVPGALLDATLTLAAAHSATHVACGTAAARASVLADSIGRVLFLSKARTLVLLMGLAMIGGLGAWASLPIDGHPEPSRKAPETTQRQQSEKADPNHEVQPPPKDVYGDPLPPGAVARMGTIRFRHSGPVTSLAFHPKGKVLASAGQDNSVRLWDLATGKLLRRLTPNRREFGVALVHAVAWSPDGRYLASGTSMLDATVRLWDAHTGKELQAFSDLRFDAYAVLFSADGRELMAGGRDKKICVWDLKGVQPTRLLSSHVDEIRALALSADGKVLACCGTGISLLDPVTGKVIRLLKGLDKVRSAAFSPDGNTLLSGDESHHIRVWDVATGKEIHTISNQLNIAAALAPTGRLLASAGTEIRFWDTTTWKKIRTFPGYGGGEPTLAFSPDGKLLAISGHDQVVRLWDVATLKEKELPPGHQSPVGSLCFSADGKTLASTSDGTLRLWDTASGTETGRKGRLAGNRRFSGFHSVRFTPDGRQLVAASSGRALADEKIHRWDLHTGKELVPLNPPDGSSTHVAVSADGKVLAVAHSEILVSALITGKAILRLPGTNRPVGALALSGDGKYVAVGWHSQESGSKGSIVVWNTTTGKRVWEFKSSKRLFGVGTLVFSPDSSILVAGIQSAEITEHAIVFDVATGKELVPFEGPISFLWSAAFSPDGKTLVTGGGEGGIRLWEVATRKIRLVLRGDQGIIHSLAFSPDGLRLASAGNDTTALVWDLRGEDARTRLSDQQLARAWSDLAGAADDAYRAVRILSAAPEQSVPFLKKLMPPVAAADPNLLERLLADLGSARFAVRDKAARELAEMGESAEPALRAALKTNRSLEARQRIERLLQTLEQVTTLREMRALEALERTAVQGSRPAHELLRTLAGGAPDARLTREAVHCLERANRSGQQAHP
jgi:RNA polymerase sigma factor (sigma-70 family)